MAVEQDHLDRANLNLELAADLLETFGQKYYDWTVTVLFYVAVHLIEAKLACNDVHSGHHKERKKSMQRDRVLNAVMREYNDLYNRSRDARYGRNAPLPFKVFYKSDVRRSFMDVRSIADGLDYRGALSTLIMQRLRGASRT